METLEYTNHTRARKRLNMEPVQKGSDSLNQDVDFELSAPENTPDKISSARTGTESLQIELDLSKDQSMELSFGEGNPSLSELN